MKVAFIIEQFDPNNEIEHLVSKNRVLNLSRVPCIGEVVFIESYTYEHEIDWKKYEIRTKYNQIFSVVCVLHMETSNSIPFDAVIQLKYL
jgi:hypothetical protein